MIKIILLGLSASIDSWAVGAAYRAGDIRIPWYTKAIVALVSAVTSMTAVFLGNGMGHFIDTAYIQMAGGFVLFVIGARSVWGVYHHREEKNYDADSSKTIDPWEGVLLGGVLASDSFCGGLSLCAMGAEAYIFPFVVGILTYGFLLLADKKVKCIGASHYFAGIALAVIGVMQLAGAMQ